MTCEQKSQLIVAYLSEIPCRTQQPQPQQTGLLPVLAVTAAVAGFIWWRRHKQNASEPRKKAQERGSRFHFPKGKTAAAGNAR